MNGISTDDASTIDNPTNNMNAIGIEHADALIVDLQI